MKSVSRKHIEQLLNDPLAFAMMMENTELEEVIAQFVSVLIQRKPYRGDQN